MILGYHETLRRRSSKTHNINDVERDQHNHRRCSAELPQDLGDHRLFHHLNRVSLALLLDEVYIHHLSCARSNQPLIWSHQVPPRLRCLHLTCIID